MGNFIPWILIRYPNFSNKKTSATKAMFFVTLWLNPKKNVGRERVSIRSFVCILYRLTQSRCFLLYYAVYWVISFKKVLKNFFFCVFRQCLMRFRTTFCLFCSLIFPHNIPVKLLFTLMIERKMRLGTIRALFSVRRNERENRAYVKKSISYK